VVEHFRPLYVVSPPVAPFVFFAPLPLKLAPKGAIPLTLRNTVLQVGRSNKMHQINVK